MNKNQVLEVESELELAELMVKDLQKLWASYAKKALEAKQERELRQEKKGFLEYETVEELINGYGYGFGYGEDEDREIYRRGLEYFENLKQPPKLSVIEHHRANIKALLDNYKGTVKMLKDELDELEGKKNLPQESVFERLERQEREERSRMLQANELIGRK